MKLFKSGVILLVVSVLLFVSCTDDCEEGVIVTQDLNLSPVTKVVNRTPSDVIIDNSNNQKVEATGFSHVMDRLVGVVKYNTVTFDYSDYDNFCIDHFSMTSICVSTPKLEYVKLDYTGNIFINDFVDQGDITIENDHIGDITFNAIKGTENLNVKILSTGDVHGLNNLPDLKKLNVELKESGDYKGFAVETVNATIVSDGSGKCEVYASGKLNVTINGSGNVYFKGYPTEVKLSGNGTGQLIDANEESKMNEQSLLSK